MCTHVGQNFWKVSSNSEHHSKPTMNINSQRHNLLRNQISPKSEDFCILWPFCTLVTMATAAILNFSNPQNAATCYGGYSYKVWWKESQFFLNPPFFGLSRSTRCGCCSYQVSSISVRRLTCYDQFCVLQFISILAVSMVMAAILKIPKVVCTSTHSA